MPAPRRSQRARERALALLAEGATLAAAGAAVGADASTVMRWRDERDRRAAVRAAVVPPPPPAVAPPQVAARLDPTRDPDGRDMLARAALLQVVGGSLPCGGCGGTGRRREETCEPCEGHGRLVADVRSRMLAATSLLADSRASRRRGLLVGPSSRELTSADLLILDELAGGGPA